MRVALFVTCVNDALYPATGIATVRLLERLGVEVDFPAAQTCCGQPQFNTGYRRETEPLVRRTTRAFEGYEYVVTPSGSCVAMVRDHYPKFGETSLPSRTYELTEFLVDVLGVTDVGAYFPHTVTYHPSCHGLRMLGLGDRPRKLLDAVKGLELRELPGAEECCGFGGTFAVKNAEVSAAMGRDKVRNAVSTGADVLCGADNSCLMHIDGILRRQAVPTQGVPLRALHIADILASTEEEPYV
ncbi:MULTISPECIES: (Fe-S)-binding protein [unclassified Streptomyces]|uniref:(Fe-S)-binding protein n=1 Tax=unclassified Streptomyces TaxID=2593676 RepID=UPI002DDBF75D|nr:(Fe-S)-binding protein [Streptomyces sp. NBC_01750]WSA98877.1 (Fe-S)-binding protein [Streptomyces sp. NBC_01794]WSD36552.1 (Fe-S)-binding protein [Streptomyces sp. NBC_01750]